MRVLKKMKLMVCAVLMSMTAVHAAMVVDLKNGTGGDGGTVFTFSNLEATPIFNGGGYNGSTTLINSSISGASGSFSVEWRPTSANDPVSWDFDFGSTFEIRDFTSGWGASTLNDPTVGSGQFQTDETFLLTFDTSSLVLDPGKGLAFSVSTRDTGDSFKVYKRTGVASASITLDETTVANSFSSVVVVEGVNEFAIVQTSPANLLNGFSIEVVDVGVSFPETATWDQVPQATDSTTVEMSAEDTGISGVEYYFQRAGGPYTGWQTSPSYEDTGLEPETTYMYWVIMRYEGTTNLWSTGADVTTEASGGDDITPPTPNPASWAVVPTARDSSSITMTATTGDDPSGVQYYFTRSDGENSGWQTDPTYVDTGLLPETEYFYQFCMRDSSANNNMGGWSGFLSATTRSEILSDWPSDWPDADLDGIPDVNDPDKDGDKMWDAWELAHFGSLSDSDGNIDSDSDGYYDFLEFVYNTDPTNSASIGYVLTEGTTWEDSGIPWQAITWTARNDISLGATYYVNYSDPSGNWFTLADNEYVVRTEEDQPGDMTTITIFAQIPIWANEITMSKYAIQPAGFVSCGISSIDQIRLNVAASSTTAGNYYARRAGLSRWFRLLWRQGIDMSDFNESADWIMYVSRTSPNATERQALDNGFAVLSAIQENPTFINDYTPNVQPGSSSKTDWTMYMGGDGENSGYSPDNGPSEGKIAWRYPKGGGWYAKPIVEDGRIYLSGPGPDVVACCLDEVSGRVIWEHRQHGFRLYVEKGSYENVMVGNNYIALDMHAQLYKRVVNKKTGAWVANEVEDTETSYRAYYFGNDTIRLGAVEETNELSLATDTYYWQKVMNDPTVGEPIIAGNFVYGASEKEVFKFNRTRAGGQVWARNIAGLRNSEKLSTFSVENGLLCVTTTHNRMFALDLNGNQAWGANAWQCDDVSFNNHVSQFFSTPRTSSSGCIYVGAANGKLYCLDATNGTQKWEYDTGSWIRSRPLVIGSTVYVADLDGTLHALADQSSEASLEWKTRLNAQGIIADLAGENIILAAGRDMILYAVAPASGKIQWQHGIIEGTWINGKFIAAGWATGFMATPTVAENVMYVGGPDGFVNALDAETGEPIWRTEIGGLLSAAPVIAKSANKLFIGQGPGDGDRFYALDLTTGEKLWSSAAFGKTWVSPVYANNKLFFGNQAGMMYGIDLDGTELWHYDTSSDQLPGDNENIGVYSIPCADENNVYVGSWSGHYYCFRQNASGATTPVWKTKTISDDFGGRPDSAAVMVHNGYLYVQKEGREIAVLRKTDGRLTSTWECPPYALQNGTVAAIDNLVIGSHAKGVSSLPHEARIVAFKEWESGDFVNGPEWTYYGDGGGLTAPVTCPGKIIFGSSAGMFVRCLDLNGNLLWRVQTGGEMLENVPAIYGNKVYVHGKNGWIFAIQ